VLLEGETGTGKEVLARAIHLNGPRRERPFVPQNCAALPDNLLESELFGVVRGAFTGADRDRRGLFEEAEGGTLFLDEIGEMSVQMQAKILRILQDQEVRPLGSSKGHRVDVRIITATNMDLEQGVEMGTFRKDLFYRLSVLPIRVPPLRDRREDIPFLAEHFLRIYAQREEKHVRGFEPAAMALLERYDWPGNVRELENEVHRLVTFCPGGMKIGADLISDRVRGFRAPFEGLIDERSPLRDILDRVEAQVVEQRLHNCQGNKTAAAESLRVTRDTLYQKIAKYAIETAPSSEGSVIQIDDDDGEES
jgi:transcriptional regulator with PAS, ATPase and Fis domain